MKPMWVIRFDPYPFFYFQSKTTVRWRLFSQFMELCLAKSQREYMYVCVYISILVGILNLIWSFS